MADWENLRHFGALSATGSLSAAARLLRVEHATVARRVAALEAELQLKLVDRRGRRLTLTEDGERIAALVQRMETEATAIGRAVDGARSELAGTVTISAPPALAAAMLTAPLVGLQKRHPDLTIRILGETRSASLERREADIAVRLSRPQDGDLIIVKLAEMPFRLYASPTYLAETEEGDWRFISYDEPMNRSAQHVALQRIAGVRPISFLGSTSEIQQAAARAGAGIAILPEFVAAGDQELVAVGIGETLPVRELWLAIHSDLKNSAPIRAVSRCLRETFERHG
ncbi:DNA-binding transcriptional LysR family regulator [Rhodopseudomonas julia]|uniref:DNA-binding transcriptional LysR family regulator n=1 Tax=Rhodopseudomonas julia TaxID=200617 RepID=A0ABU0C4L6_9BRAD|nr:LysR family transcriptional regulator [Rhodopseudomonas julia]MDQ0325458.1 DNA-binding transcriptional LysR family regulator [Rhodopseudomonas julia]